MSQPRPPSTPGVPTPPPQQDFGKKTNECTLLCILQIIECCGPEYICMFSNENTRKMNANNIK